MTYRPAEAVYSPPWMARAPGYAYLALALAIAAFVVIGEQSGSNTWLFDYVVVRDSRRVMSVRVFSAMLLMSSIATVLRGAMRGIRIYGDGVEARDVSAFVLPKIRRYRWPQVECIILNQPTRVAFDLWDGSRQFLPVVGDHDTLVTTLEQVAAARAIPVIGGRGLDDIPDPIDDVFDEDEA